MYKPLRFVGPGVALGTALALGACATTLDPSELPAGVTAGGSIDDYVLVDCLLPGQIRQLGTRMTYLAPRRSVKATRRDCGIRGGEYVLFDRSDYGTALRTLLPQAERGDPVAQSYVAEIYEKGLGLPAPNPTAAANWYRKAAEQGNIAAQTSLGALYESGVGVPQDKAKALDWYRRATGLTGDKLVFESQYEAERKAFREEIALRKQVATGLKAQARRAPAAAPRSPARPAAKPAAPARRTAATPTPAAPTPATPTPATPAPATPTPEVTTAPAPAPVADQATVQRLIQSQQRDASREAELREKALHAVRTVKEADAPAQGGEASSAKAAQAGKLELSLRQEIGELRATSAQLAAAATPGA